MRLYEGTTRQFIEDTVQNQVSEKLRQSFENYYGRRPSPSEIVSWTNSLQFVKNVLERGKLEDNGVILEYELPYSNERIDCILFGNGLDEKENAVVIELKQWSKVKDCDIEGNVYTFIGQAERMVAHPSLQVAGYHYLLNDFIEIFSEKKPANLFSCVYCHNYPKTADAVLFLPKFNEILNQFPVYTKDDFESITKILKEKLGKGNGLELLNRFATSGIRPSKKLLEHAEHMIKGNRAFSLIDEQITAYNTILDRAKKCSKLKQKSIIIVRGGPGTGKSVIALNVLAELLSKGKTVYHATGSAAFTTTLREIVGSRTAKFFKYFNSFMTAKENEIDILICDEAHRIRETSNSRFTKKEFRSNTPQIDELIRAAKVSVFFIDDYQVVRQNEIGNTGLINEAAKRFNAEVYDFELKTQFRCSGSDGFLNWIDNTLAVRETANPVLTKNEKMDFKIFQSPQELFDAVKAKNSEKENSARLVAGFCWPWSDSNSDGTLKDDVVIGTFKMPWEGKAGAKLAPGIPEASLWAHDPNGVNQIGSIYTIQGFEFEYVGVIFGKDLRYDPVRKEWVGDVKGSADPTVKRAKDKFTSLVKNTYRVLLTRGMKGCYVHFLDKDTESYFRSRIESKT